MRRDAHGSTIVERSIPFPTQSSVFLPRGRPECTILRALHDLARMAQYVASPLCYDQKWYAYCSQLCYAPVIVSAPIPDGDRRCADALCCLGCPRLSVRLRTAAPWRHLHCAEPVLHGLSKSSPSTSTCRFEFKPFSAIGNPAVHQTLPDRRIRCQQAASCRVNDSPVG